MLFDSTIVIDYLNGVEAAEYALAISGQPAISVMTWIEVMAGTTTPEEDAQARGLLAGYTVLPLDENVAEETVRIRRERRIKVPDAVILATARVAGLTLCTRNTKDFPATDPGVHVPYRV